MSQIGAPEDLREFYVREQPRVFRAVAAIVGDRTVADELTQDAFVRVCRDWERVRVMDNPGAWAHRVAVNFSMSWFRRRGAERRARERMDPTDSIEPAVDATAVAVREALSALPREERAVIALRFFADQTYQATAQALGIPEGTVKTRQRRALAALGASGLLIDLHDEDLS